MKDEEIPAGVAQLKQWLSEKRQALETAGVAVIEGTYRGDGDEGHFEGIDVIDSQGLPIEFDLPKKIADLIESLADQLAPPGYEDGDGGGGEVRLNVNTGSITHESYYLVFERSSQGLETY